MQFAHSINKETLLTSIPKELTQIPGFQQKRLDRTCNGGGVALYVRDSIKLTVMVSPRIIFYWTREGQFTAPLITLRRTENSYWYCFQFEEPFRCLDNRTFCDCWLEPERGGAP